MPRPPYTDAFKVCNKCLVKKPIEQYDRKDPKKNNYRRSECKQCRKDYNASCYEQQRKEKYEKLKKDAEEKNIEFIEPKRWGVRRKKKMIMIKDPTPVLVDFE